MQLVWSSDADDSVKARVCHSILSSIASYALDQLGQVAILDVHQHVQHRQSCHHSPGPVVPTLVRVQTPHISEVQQRISKADMIWTYRWLKLQAGHWITLYI